MGLLQGLLHVAAAPRPPRAAPGTHVEAAAHPQGTTQQTTQLHLAHPPIMFLDVVTIVIIYVMVR